MDKEYFLALLNKYRKQEATAEERKFLESYYELLRDEPGGLDFLTAAEREELKNSIKSAVRENIRKTEQAAQKIRRIGRRAMAAAAVLLVLFSTGYWFLLKRPQEKPATADNSLTVKHSRENRVIFLADGSTVMLSPGSKLNYPSSFDDLEKREVFLDGQAFFDIRHNASQPFVVHTGKLKVTVLGTAFNVKAMPDEADITVTVEQGKVSVSNQDKVLGIIRPNEQITYDKTKVSAVMKLVTGSSYLEWKNRDLFVDNVTISEAARLLEEQFKVRIVISDSSISSQRFTATFARNANFEQAIQSICVFNGLSYTYNRKSGEAIIGSNRKSDANN